MRAKQLNLFPLATLGIGDKTNHVTEILCTLQLRDAHARKENKQLMFKMTLFPTFPLILGATIALKG